ncbi:uncharacterized protein LOC135179464 isoform X2 [Pogoniulus pusillus]|uniref:uncharacterized protein LOC135179464 isoform X2 n=1 Tax=Pogoniulus pusillus TaxID=488313 RepID=UPI0030B98DFD
MVRRGTVGLGSYRPPPRCHREEAGSRCRFHIGGIGCSFVTRPHFTEGGGMGVVGLWNRCGGAAGMSAAESRPRCRWSGEAVLRARAEAAGYRRLLRARAAEVEALRGAVGALHRQLEGLRDRRSGELAKYQGDAGERGASSGLPGPVVMRPRTAAPRGPMSSPPDDRAE